MKSCSKNTISWARPFLTSLRIDWWMQQTIAWEGSLSQLLIKVNWRMTTTSSGNLCMWKYIYKYRAFLCLRTESKREVAEASWTFVFYGCCFLCCWCLSTAHLPIEYLRTITTLILMIDQPRTSAWLARKRGNILGWSTSWQTCVTIQMVSDPLFV